MPEAASTTTLTLEIRIAAPRKRVWKALTQKTGRWWPSAFHALPWADRFSLDPVLGGRLVESAKGRKGSGGTWYTVTLVDEPSALALVGYIAPPYGGPVVSMLRLDLAEDGEATALRLTDAMVGRIDQKFEHDTLEGWKQIFDAGLRAFVEAAKKDSPAPQKEPRKNPKKKG